MRARWAVSDAPRTYVRRAHALLIVRRAHASANHCGGHKCIDTLFPSPHWGILERIHDHEKKTGMPFMILGLCARGSSVIMAIQWNSDFSNLQGKQKFLREIGSSRNRRWHQMSLNC